MNAIHKICTYVCFSGTYWPDVVAFLVEGSPDNVSQLIVRHGPVASDSRRGNSTLHAGCISTSPSARRRCILQAVLCIRLVHSQSTLTLDTRRSTLDDPTSRYKLSSLAQTDPGASRRQTRLELQLVAGLRRGRYAHHLTACDLRLGPLLTLSKSPVTKSLALPGFSTHAPSASQSCGRNWAATPSLQLLSLDPASQASTMPSPPHGAMSPLPSS